MIKQLFLLGAIILSAFNAFSQTFPTYQTACTFDNTNGTTGNVSVLRESDANYGIAPQYYPVQISFGANASSSVSGLNEVEAVGGTVTNYTGGPLAQIVVAPKGVGYWTKTTPATTFQYYTWNPAAQRFEGTLGDGRWVRVYILGVTIGGVAIPTDSIKMTNFSPANSGYVYAATTPNLEQGSFTDNGTTHTTPAASISLPNSLLAAKLGPVAAGGTLSNVRMKYGVQLSDGGDAWNGVNGGGATSFYFQVTIGIYGLSYDYGDAPSSYGSASHAFKYCAGPLYIGTARPDYEASVAGSATVSADNTNTAGYNDEDITATNYAGTTSYSISVPYNNKSGAAAYLSGWIDWNGNGSFEASEKATAAVPSGASSVVLNWRTSGAAGNEGTIPGAMPLGYKIARLRVGTVQAEVANPSGNASDGEVEDLRFQATNALPVSFGSISATVVNGQLKVNWQTVDETNNDHFEVEASNDGEHFKPIGTVISKAVNGNSTVAIDYSFNYELTGGLAISLLFLGLGMAGRRKSWLLFSLATGLCIITIISCKKDSGTDVSGAGKVFVRVAQVDKDGTKKYSKVVQATQP